MATSLFEYKVIRHIEKSKNRNIKKRRTIIKMMTLKMMIRKVNQKSKTQIKPLRELRTWEFLSEK